MNLPQNFNQEEINLHNAVQILSLTGVNLLEALPDDSQNTVIWDKASGAILGRSFVLNQHTYQMALGLAPFTLMLLDKSANPIKTIDIGRLDKPALYSIWQDWLANLSYQGNLVTKLHYDLPENEYYAANLFNGLTKEFVAAWTQLRTMANQAMEHLNQVAGIGSEINIWPHHFDTGVYYAITDDKGKTTQSIGAGLAIADTLIHEPYFYIYGWTKEGSIDYGKAIKLAKGQWLTDGWQGAVLKATDIPNAESVNIFFKSSYQFLFNQLKNS